MKPVYTYLTPGPSALFPSVATHLQNALEAQVPSISHRSVAFQDIYQEADQHLRALLGLPANYRVLFCASANEIWERLLQNCVAHTSAHLVNGAFSRRFYQFALWLQKSPFLHEVAEGQGFEISQMPPFPADVELLALTHNETSTGVAMPEADLHALARQYPDALTVVDMVSSAPYPALDYGRVDSAYFSVQKAFGLPAGLGVWLVGPRGYEKAQSLEKKGQITGTYHRLTALWKEADNFQTPETPNVLAIYLLAKIAGEMRAKGLATIRESLQQQAAQLYQKAETMPQGRAFVQNPAWRSPTVVVVESPLALKIRTALKEKGFVVGSGYKPFQDTQLRIANFPATSTLEMQHFHKAWEEVMAALD